MKAMKLPTLFKKTSVGKIQEWTISVSGATIVTRFGQTGGKIQEARDEVKEGKNVGRSNETSPKQQAEAEAQSQWEKKLKKGYVKNQEDAQEGKVDDVIEGGYFPMLAHKYSERGDEITFPAYLQPKFDGHRCCGVIQAGESSLWSRSRKPINSMPHIQEELDALGEEDLLVDGELYHHEYRNRFEELSHFIRQQEPIEGCEVVQYHIYDLNLDCSFAKRLDLMRKLAGRVGYDGDILRFVETIEVANEDEMFQAFRHFRNQGYEGAMVRNANGHYISLPPPKRSPDLQKVKEFDDDEFEVIGVEEGRGKMEGLAIFICKTKKGTPFNVKMEGPLEELAKYFKNPEKYIGKMLTVRYQGLTNKNKVPRFPVAERFAVKL